MANIHPNITPKGCSQKDLVDLLYMIVYSIYGLCLKLDNDTGVALTTYTANCYTNIFTVKIENSKGSVIGNTGSMAYSISPIGVSDDALLQLMYEITNSFETLTEQLDGDATVADDTYEEKCYEAKFLHIVENKQGLALGNGTAYYFGPGGVINYRELIDWLYNCVDALETLTEQLDADSTEGSVTGTNFEALWFTATILLRIEDSSGNQIGVTKSIN